MCGHHVIRVRLCRSVAKSFERLVDKRTDAVLAGDLQQLGPIVNLKSENALDGRARLMQEHR